MLYICNRIYTINIILIAYLELGDIWLYITLKKSCGRVKPETITLVFAGSQLSKQYTGTRSKNKLISLVHHSYLIEIQFVLAMI